MHLTGAQRSTRDALASDMDPFLLWLESTEFSTWVRESPSVFAFPAILSCHTVGMGLVAGINAALALRILGVGPGIAEFCGGHADCGPSHGDQRTPMRAGNGGV